MSRRGFVRSAGMSAAGGLAAAGSSLAASDDIRSQSLRHGVRVATITLEGIRSETPEGSVDQVIERLEEVVTADPDIICLPEVFNTARSDKRSPKEEIAQPLPGPTTERLGDVARSHKTYIIAPMIVDAGGGTFHNSAVLIDRSGEVVGRYNKNRPTIGEMEGGTTPGFEVPTFETDFGTVGMQICYDVFWEEGWRKLRKQGADIVFWPSAYSGGRPVQMKAMEHSFYVVISSWHDPSSVIDKTGHKIMETGTWRNYVCAQINLEKDIFQWDPESKIDRVQQTYGNDVAVHWMHEENWWVVESLNPDLTMDQIKEECDLEGRWSALERAEEVRERYA